MSIISVRSVRLEAPGRGNNLTVRVTAPATGTDLPVVVLSHGFQQSERSYDPLVDAWAEHFVVVQPTHLDSLALGLAADDPRTPDIWRTRGDDLARVLDQLDVAVTAVPGLESRVDLARVALAGHSWGGQSAGMLLGARVFDGEGNPGESRLDRRVSAGLLLATTGTGESLNAFAVENFAFMRPDFSGLSTPTLVVAGDADQSLLSTRGPDWFVDPYLLSPGASDLLTIFGGEHSLGGITGYGVTVTTDENPQRVAMVARVTTAWLRRALRKDDVELEPGDLGQVTSK